MISDHAEGFPGPGTHDRGDAEDAADQGALAEWLEAQAQHASALAEAALSVGAFRERMRVAPDGARSRLLFWQAVAIAAIAGERVPVDQFALMRLGQLFGPVAGSQSFRQASAVFDALEGASPQRPMARGRAELLHPLIRAAFHCLRTDFHPAGDSVALSLALAVRLADPDPSDTCGFLPVLPRPWPKPGAEARVAWWLDALQSGCAQAMAQLTLLEDWRNRANIALKGWSGRTPQRLVRVIGAWPLVSAAMAQTEIRASRAAIQRNLDRLQREGLVREVTGQDRYRLWAADLGPVSRTPAPSTTG